MSIPSALDGFDVPAAVGRMLDQPVLWWQAIGLFVEHFAAWEAEWRASVGDDALERKKVHALRSAAANVGALKVAAHAEALENCLLARLAGSDSDIPVILRQQLQTHFSQAWQVATDAWLASAQGERT